MSGLHLLRNAVQARKKLFAMAMSLAVLACTESGGGVCDYCEPSNPLKACRYDLVCVNYMCVRPGGNLPGECCDQGPAECSDDSYCVYRRCAASPIHPPPKEDIETLSDPFTFQTLLLPT